jgi:transposase-like protein
MRMSRFTEEQIIRVLEAAEAGEKAPDLCRKHGISEQTFYRWKAKFGGMDVWTRRSPAMRAAQGIGANQLITEKPGSPAL